MGCYIMNIHSTVSMNDFIILTDRLASGEILSWCEIRSC